MIERRRSPVYRTSNGAPLRLHQLFEVPTQVSVQGENGLVGLRKTIQR
jgi:hypothetical protein